MICNIILRQSGHLAFFQTRPLSYFITTPIFYVNSAPHIGHVHTLLLADALNIYNRLKLNDNRSILSTGTDEHGIKVQTAAQANKMGYQEFCDANTNKFTTLFDQYDTTLSDFIRTTDKRHEEAVSSIWTELDEKGFIYKSTYSGWYCVSDEVFVPESQVIVKEIEGQQIHQDQNENQLVWSSEENYMFRFSQLEDRVLKWLTEEKPVIPEKFNQTALNMMTNSKIGDISISRPRNRLEWGIPVPGDPSQTIYVWLDALTNYLTVAGYPCPKDKLKRWPIDCQILGKDIVKFHAIYWPAFLLALSLSLPKRLICHSHWMVDSLKMSKSRGNVVDPLEENQKLTIEGLRYYLLRCSTTHSDTDYNPIQATRRVNAELADTFGNLLSRCCAPAINPSQSFPRKLLQSSDTSKFNLLIDQLKKTISDCTNHYENADFYKGVDEIMAALRLNNALYEEYKPWSLVKQMSSDKEAHENYLNLQAITYESLRICSLLLQPIVPKLSARALDRLNVANRWWKDVDFSLDHGDPTSDVVKIKPAESPLFRRLKRV